LLLQRNNRNHKVTIRTSKCQCCKCSLLVFGSTLVCLH